MKRIICHTVLLAFLATLISASQMDNFCDLYGAVYTTTSKKHADYKVYIEDSEAFADAIIFKEENELFADTPGKWHFVENQAFADFTVYITTNRRAADFTIYYTELESFAGCN